MRRLQRTVTIVAVTVSAADAQAPALSSCTIRGLKGDVQCGSVRVPENPRNPAGRQVDLFVVVARATGSGRASDPFLLLAGGPGQAGSLMGEFATDVFGRVREQRDIVLLDVRGTGRSNPLGCRLMRRSADLVGWTLYPADAIRLCRDSLSRHADLAMYTTSIIVNDIEAVRRAFGWPALNVYGRHTDRAWRSRTSVGSPRMCV